MTARPESGTPLSAAAGRARGFWAYYRRYTNTAIHTATTAALTAFGLLIFIDPSFAWLAIASYLLPPVVLYAIGSDAGAEDEDDPDRSTPVSRPARNGESVGADPDSDGSSAAVADEDRDGADHDYDGPDLDSDGHDADADGPDRDYDGPDLDHDGPDRDADGSDGDADGPDRDADGADHDHDGVDRDADGVDVDRDG